MYKLLTIAFLHVYERIDIIRFQIHVLSFDKNTNWKTQFVTLKKKLSEYIYMSYIHCINLKKTRCVQDLLFSVLIRLYLHLCNFCWNIKKKYKVNIQAILHRSASINFDFNFAIKEALRYNFFFQISLMTAMFKEKSTVHFLCIRVCKK